MLSVVMYFSLALSLFVSERKGQLRLVSDAQGACSGLHLQQ